ncbi:hypothetical protein D3C72_2245210 [compost metagenome]
MQQSREHDLHFQSCERLTDALVRAVSERDLCPGITVDIEDMRVHEFLFVAICRNAQHDDRIAAPDQLSSDDDVFPCDTTLS